MPSDDLTSPEDPEWVDAIVRRALERAATEPATTEPVVAEPAGTPAAVPPLQSPAVDQPAAPLVSDAVTPPGPVAPRPTDAEPQPVPTSGQTRPAAHDAPAPVAVGAATANGIATAEPGGPVSAYPFDIDGNDGDDGVDDALFDDALALDETHDAAVSSRMRSFLEWGAVIVGALAVALLIKTFLMQAYFIPSSSMETTLEISDRVLVNKLSYAVGDVSRGDLVVFSRPPTQPSGEPDLIKRVIGLGGETIQFRDGEVFIKEPGGTEYQLLREPYLDDGVTTNDFPGGALPANCIEESVDVRACTIPDGHLFMMGDNRGGSSDSRVFGPIDEDLVVGRAFLRVWPLNRLGFL